jgi:hypothetical protein
VEKPQRDHLEDPDVDGRIILQLTFKKWDEGEGLFWLRIEESGGHL